MNNLSLFLSFPILSSGVVEQDIHTQQDIQVCGITESCSQSMDTLSVVSIILLAETQLNFSILP